MTPKLTIYKFVFKLEAQADLNLNRFTGSLFRGAFGASFRRAVCITKMKTCENCYLKDNCSYFNIFETEIKEHSLDFLQGVQKSPHPFVLEPPGIEKSYYKKGETFTAGLIVFGDIIKMFPFFLYTIQKMGERGLGRNRIHFLLSSASSLDVNNYETVIFRGETNILKTEYSPITEKEIISKIKKSDKITLEFITPLRVQKAGIIIKDKGEITPELLYFTFFRRIISVSHLFCGGEATKLEKGFAPSFSITENNLRYKVLTRYSARQKQKMELGGLVGSITLEGDLTNFLPLVYIGREVHVGKNTAFGHGKFIITE